MKVLDLLKARMEALASPPQAIAEAPAETEAAPPVAAVLDPEDPWARRRSMASSERSMEAEAPLNDATDLRGRADDTSDAARYEQAIAGAIRARHAQVERRAA